MSLPDRILGAFDRLAATALAREGLPDPRYGVPWSYSVTSSTDTTFTGRAISARCPHPDIRDVPNMPGVPGTKLQPAVGSIVGVLFLDGDPAQPRVTSWDPSAATVVKIRAATIPSAPVLTLDISPTLVQVYEDPNTIPPTPITPSPQAVALAPAVTTFANASTTLATASGNLETAAAVFATAIGAAIPAPPATLGAGDPVFGAAVVAFTTALATYISAVNSYTTAVNALVGTFPTGLTSTKLSTQ